MGVKVHYFHRRREEKVVKLIFNIHLPSMWEEMIDAMHMCESWCRELVNLNLRGTRLHSSTWVCSAFSSVLKQLGDKIRISKSLLFQINKKGWEQLPVPTSQVCTENLNSLEALLRKHTEVKCFFPLFCYLALQQRVFSSVSSTDGLAINPKVWYYLWLIYNK